MTDYPFVFYEGREDPTLLHVFEPHTTADEREEKASRIGKALVAELIRLIRLENKDKPGVETAKVCMGCSAQLLIDFGRELFMQVGRGDEFYEKLGREFERDAELFPLRAQIEQGKKVADPFTTILQQLLNARTA